MKLGTTVPEIATAPTIRGKIAADALVEGLRELARNAPDETGRSFYSAILAEIERTEDVPGVIARVLELIQQAYAAVEAGE
ncbi:MULTISPECIES: hypothetical protein [unclassified Streptomyces]|uniref:hypothetical protein n=1 Tax=unclassified Streptomyces TaxID=2593676 RepID=UPI0036E69680